MTAHHLSSVVAKGSESDRKFDGRFQRDEKGQTDVFWSILKWVVSDVPRSILGKQDILYHQAATRLYSRNVRPGMGGGTRDTVLQLFLLLRERPQAADY